MQRCKCRRPLQTKHGRPKLLKCEEEISSFIKKHQRVLKNKITVHSIFLINANNFGQQLGIAIVSTTVETCHEKRGKFSSHDSKLDCMKNCKILIRKMVKFRHLKCQKSPKIQRFQNILCVYQDITPILPQNQI